MADIKNFAVNMTDALVAQVESVGASEAYKDSKIRIMPDGHVGKGAVVGSTITFDDKIIPYTVGVDVACRVSLFRIPSSVDLAELDKAIHAEVPAGFGIRNEEVLESVLFNYGALSFWNKGVADGDINESRVRRSMGTMGGGNHAIAVDEAEDGNKYLLIHCGSRGLGVLAAEHHQDVARRMMADRHDDIYQYCHDLVREARSLGHVDRIQGILDEMKAALVQHEDKDLAYLTGPEMDAYLNDMRVIQKWTFLNHTSIYDNIADRMGWDACSIEALYATCVHNYVDVDDKVIRKGSISAHEGELGIIPLNMRDGTLVVRGRGNEDWNCSLPHGAGRRMSRSEARKNLDEAVYKESMKEVYSSTVNAGTLDEAPMAYNDTQAIVEAIQPNASIVTRLREIYNYKDDSAK